MLFLFFVNAKLCEGIEGLLGWRTVGQEISIKFGEEGRKTNRQLSETQQLLFEQKN